jgi:hypothetical protein
MFFLKKIKIAAQQPDCNVSGSGTLKQNQPSGFIFQSILAFFKRSVIRFFSVLTRFFHQLSAFLC